MFVYFVNNLSCVVSLPYSEKKCHPLLMADHYFAISDMIEATPTVPSTEAQGPITFKETDRSSEDPTPSTSKDTVPFIKVQRLSTSNRMTIPVDKDIPTKTLEITNPIPKLSTLTVKRK